MPDSGGCSCVLREWGSGSAECFFSGVTGGTGVWPRHALQRCESYYTLWASMLHSYISTMDTIDSELCSNPKESA